MATLTVGGRELEIELVIFDKDGTLIDFHHMWGARAAGGLDALAAAAAMDAPLRHGLYNDLGCELQTGRASSHGPLATASIAKLCTIAATSLYRQGVAWPEAESQVQQHFEPHLNALPVAEQVRPLGDVPALFRALATAGVHIALATSDDRAPTKRTIELLGVQALVSLWVSGDDDIPNKPAPDAVHHIAKQLGTPLSRVMMVGDTEGDMRTGASAQVGGCVAVLSGVGDRASLEPHADVVVDSIAAIEVRS